MSPDDRKRRPADHVAPLPIRETPTSVGGFGAPSHNAWGVRLIWPEPSDARLDLVGVDAGCSECGGRLGTPKPGRHICPRCHRDHIAGQRRRSSAAWRHQPLEDFRWAS